MWFWEQINNKKIKNWGTFPNSQHFKGKRACWNSEMGLKWTHKREFKMRLIYRTTKRERLMQIEWNWCDKLSKANFKHKLYMTRNLWEEASLPSLHYTLCLLPKMGITSKCHFFFGSPKTRTFVIPKLWTLIYFSNHVCFENVKAISYSSQKILSNGL